MILKIRIRDDKRDQASVFHATMFWGRWNGGSNFLEFGRRELISQKAGFGSTLNSKLLKII